jgi:hypothetical protein
MLTRHQASEAAAPLAAEGEVCVLFMEILVAVCRSVSRWIRAWADVVDAALSAES